MLSESWDKSYFQPFIFPFCWDSDTMCKPKFWVLYLCVITLCKLWTLISRPESRITARKECQIRQQFSENMHHRKFWFNFTRNCRETINFIWYFLEITDEQYLEFRHNILLESSKNCFLSEYSLVFSQELPTTTKSLHFVGMFVVFSRELPTTTKSLKFTKKLTENRRKNYCVHVLSLQ